MEILEAFALTNSYRAAGELAGCSHHTVEFWVSMRDRGLLPDGTTPVERPKLIDGFMPKIEEWVERSGGKIRGDVVFDKLVGLGFEGSDRTVRRALAGVKVNWRAGRRRVYRPWVVEPGMWAQWDWGHGPKIADRQVFLFCAWLAWLAWCRFRVVFPVWDKTVWVRVDGDEIVVTHIPVSGAVEVARHFRSTPGNPSIDDNHYPPRPAGALARQPKPTNTAEAEFLALGEGARMWLVEAAAAGTSRVKVKMANAVQLAQLHGVERVDWALGHAATFERFGEGDVASILAAPPVGQRRRAAEDHSMQPSTKAWENFGEAAS